MPDQKPSFAIMGSGGVGGYFGACLARAGNPVTFIARGAHLQAILQQGLQIQNPDGTFSLSPCTATDRPESIGKVDFVLFAVKLWDTCQAGAACEALLGPHSAVVSLQNGVDSEHQLAQLLGEDRVMGGVAEISATISGPGCVLRMSPFARLRVGELDGTDTSRCRQLVSALENAGVDVEHSQDIQRAIWKKFMFLVGLSALTAVTREPIGRIRADDQTRGLLNQVMAEVMLLAQAREITLSDDDLSGLMRFVDTLPADMRASMAIDLDRGNRLELDWLSGAVVRLAREMDLTTPANQFVHTALKLAAEGKN